MNFASRNVITRTADEIRRLADPERHYRFMEVCGGHTHAIYRFGLKDLLPANIELVHGPGCPVCVLPMGRIDDGLSIAEHPHTVIFTAFGDMMRVPGTHGSPLEYKARGMDVRIVYSPADALKLAQNESRQARDVFRHRIRDHRALHRAHADARQAKWACAISRSSAITSPSFPPSARFSIRRICASTDSSDPGHVSTVIGCRPYEWIAHNEEQTDRGLRFRAAGHAAIHRHAAAPAATTAKRRSKINTNAWSRGKAIARR